MERVSKVVLILTTILVVAALDVEGGRRIKSHDENGEGVEEPQNFYGGAAGGIFPGPPGFVTGVSFGPSGLCTLPGGCVPVPVLPTIPAVPIAGGSVPLTP
ncbi:hypothetical protein CerSpe_230100 [Prunus speciosa]